MSNNFEEKFGAEKFGSIEEIFKKISWEKLILFRDVNSNWFKDLRS